MKRRHEWSGQLLKKLLERPYEAFTGAGGVPDIPVDAEMYKVFNQLKPGMYLCKHQLCIFCS